MLQRLVQLSLQFRGIVVVLACLLIGYGLFVAAHAKLDVFPDFVPPQVGVQTECPGLTPEQVEQLVTRPIENAVNGLGGLEALRSQSIQGLSVVTAVFKDGTDIFIARQSLGERLLEAAGELPVGVKAPRMEPLTSSTMDLLKIGFTSDKLSAMELRTFADWTLKPRLLAIPGVAKCSTFGGQIRELQVQVIPARLEAFDVSLSQVIAAARDSVGVRGGGFIETENQRIILQSETPALTPEVLGNVVVDTVGGRSIRLKDVARVAIDSPPIAGDTVIGYKEVTPAGVVNHAEPGVLLTMSSQYGANTMEVTQALEELLDSPEMRKLFEDAEVEYHPALHRPASFIKSSLHNVTHSLLTGGILVSIVLFIFLMNIRTAVISLTAIPLSLLAAIIVMDKAGFTLNTITLGGLAIAIGAVVDDAIIDVENIYRRLRLNQILPVPQPRFNVVLEASMEVRSAVVYATFVLTLVFVPVLTMTGLQGKFFAPLGWAYIIAMLASLVVALTLTPALALLFFSKGSLNAHDPLFQRVLKNVYHRMLSPLLTHVWLLVSGVVAVCVLVLAALPFFGEEFLPEFREGHFVLGVSAAPGTSLLEMRRLGEEITKRLMEIPHVATAEQQIGRAELGEDTWGPEKSEFHVNLDENVSAKEQAVAEEQITALLESYPGINHEVTTFLGDRIGESISGEKASVVINLFGNNLDDLDEAASSIAEAVATLPGAGEVVPVAPPQGPRLVIRLRPDRLVQFGYRPVDILEAVRVSYEGEVVGQIYEGNQVSNVNVLLEPAARSYPEQVGDLLVRNSQDVRMPLHQLAEVYQDIGRFSIMHEGAQRRQAVTCSPSGGDVAGFVEQAKRKIAASVELPEGIVVVYGGEAQQEAAARNELIFHSAIAAVGILILLAMVFGNLPNLLLLLVNLPFALVGGVLATIFTSKGIVVPPLSQWFSHPAAALAALHLGTLSIGAMVGYVTLFGITTRNTIMMISHYEHLVKVEGMAWGKEAAARGASERLVPILMTALVTAIGLLPLALGSGEAGREIEGPMAIVILGGLVTSTLLNLLVMPALALRFGRFRGPAPAVHAV